MNTVTGLNFYSNYVIDNRLYLKEPIKINCHLYDDFMKQINGSLSDIQRNNRKLSDLPITTLEINKYIDMDYGYNQITTVTVSINTITPNHGFTLLFNNNRYVYFCGDIGVFLEDKCKTKDEIIRDKRNKNIKKLLD